MVKIDSGLINLKTQLQNQQKKLNMHAYNKRPSVNFPVKIVPGAAAAKEQRNETRDSLSSENNNNLVTETDEGAYLNNLKKDSSN